MRLESARSVPTGPTYISEAAKALAEGVRAITDGEEEPPDVGRSQSKLFVL